MVQAPGRHPYRVRRDAGRGRAGYRQPRAGDLVRIHSRNGSGWLFVLDRDAAIGREGQSARQFLDNDIVRRTTAWQKSQVVYLDAANWYLVGGGLQALQRNVDGIKTALSGKRPCPVVFAVFLNERSRSSRCRRRPAGRAQPVRRRQRRGARLAARRKHFRRCLGGPAGQSGSAHAGLVLAGAAMAVSGLILQMLARNKFVEPSTAGTAESAILGILAVTLLAPGMPVMARMLSPASSRWREPAFSWRSCGRSRCGRRWSCRWSASCLAGSSQRSRSSSPIATT